MSNKKHFLRYKKRRSILVACLAVSGHNQQDEHFSRCPQAERFTRLLDL